MPPSRNEKADVRRLNHATFTSLDSALASFEARVGLADHEYFATAAHDLAVAVTGFGRLQRGQDFHGGTELYVCGKPTSVAMSLFLRKRVARER